MTFTKTHSITAADSIKDIAKAIRADIKAAKKSGDLDPSLKVSVRMKNYHSINITIQDCDFNILNADRVKFDMENPFVSSFDAEPVAGKKFTDEAIAQRQTIEEIMNSYNWDKSDSMTDYFCVNFYGFVDFEYSLIEENRGEILRAAATEAEVQEEEVVEAPEAPVLALVEETVEVAPEAEEVDALALAEAEFEAATKALEDARKKVEAARLQARAKDLLAEAARLLAEADALAA